MTAPDLTPARLKQLLAAATPGPWHVDGFNLSGIIRRADDGEWANVAQCDMPPGFRNPNWRADAALIALSPALVARVIELKDGLQRIADAELDWTVGAADNVERLRRIARAALETPNAD